MQPSACGLWQHFQDLGHSFSLYGPPSRQITYKSLCCFSILVNCYYQVSFNLKLNLHEAKVTQIPLKQSLPTSTDYCPPWALNCQMEDDQLVSNISQEGRVMRRMGTNKW